MKKREEEMKKREEEIKRRRGEEEEKREEVGRSAEHDFSCRLIWYKEL